MRIGLDGIILRGRNAGSLRYFEQLIGGLAATHAPNEYVVFADSAVLPTQDIPSSDKFSIVHVKPNVLPAALQQQFYRSWHTFAPLDLLHSPVFAPPLTFSRTMVTTLFDLTFVLYPETSKWTGRMWRRLFVRRGIKRAHRVITLSESTKRDLCRLWQVPETKVHVIYPCAREIFCPVRDTRGTVAKYKLPEKYILYVGTLERRKNISNLLRAFARARQMGALEHTLVLAGQRGWLYDDIFRTIEELGLHNQVALLGYVPDQDLPALYSAADLFVYLSWYEGFGLPVLEAMACGAPVLVSNVSSLPEVAGDAGILVPPDDIEQAAAQIVRLLLDYDARRELSAHGLARAAFFSQAEFVRKTLTVYAEAADAVCASA